MESFLIFSLIRFGAALLILKWPLFGILLSALADGVDWDYLHVTKNFNYDFYNTWDKVMDTTYLTVAAITAIRWKDVIARRIAIFLYAFRLSGVLLFFLSQIKPLLFFFPNIFENFFIWYLVYVRFFAKYNKKQVIPKSVFVWTIIVASIAIPKIIHEYVMHIKNQQLWYIYDFNFIDKTNETLKQYMNWVGWGGLFYLIPFLIAFWSSVKFGKREGIEQ